MKVSRSLIQPLIYFFTGIALFSGTVFAQSNYILETVAAADVPRITSQYQLTVVRTIRDDQNAFVVSLAPNTSAKDIKTIQSDQSVRVFSPDTALDATESQTKPLVATSLDTLSDALLANTTTNYFGVTVRTGYVQQPATSLINLSPTQRQFPTGNGIVAVIDTGVDPTHPALKNVLVPGYDFIHNVPGMASDFADLSQSTVAILDQSTVAILDQKVFPLLLNQSTVVILDQSTVVILDSTKLPAAFGHGTMVSGLIHLVAPTAQIMPLKAFQADGTGNLSDVIRAIYYAVDHNAKVINMSFSVNDHSTAFSDAIAYAVSHGVICIASAGNNGRETVVYPAGFRGVFGVASTNKNDLRSSFSNFGDAVRLAAPGEALVTTYPGNNYAAVWGTSFSAALVSGASAVIEDYKPVLQYGYLGDVFDQGPHVAINGEGNSRLDLLASMLYCARQGNDH